MNHQEVQMLGSAVEITNGRPDTSYFIEKYSKFSQCSNQTILLQFSKPFSFGEETTIDLYQEGDILNSLYVQFLYPSGQPSAVCDSFGTYMLNWAQLEYETELIERIDGEYLEMFNDITVPQAKQGVLSNIVGKNITSNLAVYYTKLPFSIFKTGMPVCALAKNLVLRLNIRNFWEGCPTATVNPPFTAIVRANYVFLPEEERKYFINNSLTYLYEHTQRLDNFTKSSAITILSEFQNPTKQLFFVIQTVGANPYVWTNGGSDQLVNMRLLMNGIEVITTDFGTPLFLRCLQGLESHTRCPDRYFYFYNFSIDPENANPTGSINMSCVKQQIDLNLSASVTPRTIHSYSRCYNILKIEKGKLRVLYPVPFQITATAA